MSSAKVTRASDLTYHLEGFLIRTGVFRERLLQLCSAVCHTGLDFSSVSVRTVSSNSIVRSAGIDGHLKRLEKLCAPYGKIRNQIVHQHGLLDSDLRQVESLLMASRLPNFVGRRVAAAAYRRTVGELAEKKADEAEAFIRDAFALVEEIFAPLLVEYVTKQRQLCVANA